MPLITYSLLRLGLLVIALLGLWWAGMGGWLLVVVATVVAYALSYVLLRRQEAAAARWLADRRASRADRPRFSRAVEADAAAEDAAVDALRPANGHAADAGGSGPADDAGASGPADPADGDGDGGPATERER